MNPWSIPEDDAPASRADFAMSVAYGLVVGIVGVLFVAYIVTGWWPL